MAKTEFLPSFYTNDVGSQQRFGNRINFALLALWLWGFAVLAGYSLAAARSSIYG